MNLSSIEIARLLKPDVGKLDSILVPLASGGLDSHGCDAMGVNIRPRLIEAMERAKATIVEVLEMIKE